MTTGKRGKQGETYSLQQINCTVQGIVTF